MLSVIRILLLVSIVLLGHMLLLIVLLLVSHVITIILCHSLVRTRVLGRGHHAIEVRRIRVRIVRVSRLRRTSIVVRVNVLTRRDLEEFRQFSNILMGSLSCNIHVRIHVTLIVKTSSKSKDCSVHFIHRVQVLKLFSKPKEGSQSDERVTTCLMFRSSACHLKHFSQSVQSSLQFVKFMFHILKIEERREVKFDPFEKLVFKLRQILIGDGLQHVSKVKVSMEAHPVNVRIQDQAYQVLD